MAWAACGKDPGYTPEFLLDQSARHTAYTQTEIDHLNLREPLDIRNLKRKWINALDSALHLVSALPPEEVGCLYLDANEIPVTPDPASAVFTSLRRHTGKINGAWPTIQKYPGTN